MPKNISTSLEVNLEREFENIMLQTWYFLLSSNAFQRSLNCSITLLKFEDNQFDNTIQFYFREDFLLNQETFYTSMKYIFYGKINAITDKNIWISMIMV